MARFAAATAGATTALDLRRRIGALALATQTVSEPARRAAIAARRAAIAARLPVPQWPDQTYADAASVAAFGTNPLSPATRSPAARAGREVSRARAADVAAFWL